MTFLVSTTIMVSTKDTYKRVSSVLTLKPTIPTTDDNKIAWPTGERTIKTGTFQYDVSCFKESAITKFDMLPPNKMVLPVGCNVPQLRTNGLRVLAGDGSAWVYKKHDPRGWLTPSCDWELWTREVVEQCV